MVDTLTRQTSTDDMPAPPFTGANAPSLSPAASPAKPQTVLETSSLERNPDKTIPISGRLAQYISGYWQLLMSAVGMRYIAEEISKVICKWQINRCEYGSDEYKRKKDDYARKKPWQNLYAPMTGGVMMLVTGSYAWSTAKDLRTVFAGAVGWEMNKPADQVTFLDLFRSKNELVVEARHNYVKFNLRRVGVNLPFFVHLVPFLRKYDYVDGESSVGWGYGSNMFYLTMDVMSRKETFFERMQSFIDSKINHSNQVGERVNADDLINLYLRHSRDRKNSFVMPQMSSPEWQNNQKLFGRMADLMNQTYKNAPATEHADFTIDKFLYLLGEGLIKSQAMEKNLAYVEVANSPGGIDGVKDVARQVGEGKDILAAAAPYLARAHAASLEHEAVKAAVVGSAERIVADARAAQAALQASNALPGFAARLEPRAREAPPASFAEAASQRSTASPSLS